MPAHLSLTQLSLLGSTHSTSAELISFNSTQLNLSQFSYPNSAQLNSTQISLSQVNLTEPS